MTRSMRLKRSPKKMKTKKRLREEMSKLILNSTKLRKRTSQPLPKLTHLPRPSPPSRRNPRLLIKKSSKKPLIPSRRKRPLLKSKPLKPDSRKLEKERDVLDFSHQFSAHSKSRQN